MIAVGSHGSTFAGFSLDYNKNEKYFYIYPSSNIEVKTNLGKSDNNFETLYCKNLSNGITTKTMTEVLSGTTEE